MNGSGVVRLAAIALVAFGVASCAEDEVDRTGAPTAPAATAETIPTKFTADEFLQVREGEPGSGGDVTIGVVAAAEDGSEADIEFAFTDAPPGEGGRVECGGKRYDAMATLDQSRSAEGTIEIEGLGTLELDVERNLGVVLEENAPPTCDEWEGSWRGTGRLEGRRGTFLLVGFHDDETETYEETLTLEEE